MKTIIAILAIVFLVAASVQAGSREHNSKGQGQSKRSSVMGQQGTMGWLQQGCPTSVYPQTTPVTQPSQSFVRDRMDINERGGHQDQNPALKDKIYPNH